MINSTNYFSLYDSFEKTINYLYYEKIFSLVFLLTILSCNSFETYEVQPTFENNVNASHAKAKDTTLYSIQNSIINDYYQHYPNDNLNLENVISRLDSIIHSNLEFQNLKIVNYSLPTSTEIVTLINNQNNVYDNLNVSVDCKYNGYLKQPASAVFNACLFKILNN